MVDIFDLIKKIINWEDAPDSSCNNQNFDSDNSNRAEILANKKLFNKFNLIVSAFLLFILANFIITTTIFIQHSYNRPHKFAKFFLSGSAMVNTVYIIPLSKIFGPYNILTKPFYPIRDSLYSVGIKYIPKDDAEIEMWWEGIYFQEFYKIHLKKIQDIGAKRLKIKNIDKDYLNRLLAWTDELYFHLEKVATKKKLEDKYFQRNRLHLFNTSFIWYNLTRHTLIFRIEEPCYKRKYLAQNDVEKYEIKKKYPTLVNGFIDNDDEIKRLEKLLEHYENLKNYTYVYEKEGYDKLLNKKYWYLDYDVTLTATRDILSNRIIRNNFDCSDQITHLFNDSIANLTVRVPYDKDIPDWMKKSIKYSLSNHKIKPVIKFVNNKCIE